jgi:hypothetical protein
MAPGSNRTGSESSVPAAQNIPVFAAKIAANPQVEKMQRGGRCQPAS